MKKMQTSVAPLCRRWRNELSGDCVERLVEASHKNLRGMSEGAFNTLLRTGYIFPYTYKQKVNKYLLGNYGSW